MEEKEYIKQILGITDEQADLVLDWLGDAYEAGFQQVSYKVTDNTDQLP